MSDERKAEVFVDGVTGIRLMAGVVRIDMGELTRPPMEGEAPDFANKLRIFMPLDGFLRSFGTMQGLVEKLKAEGVVKPREAQAATEAKAEPGNKARNGS